MKIKDQRSPKDQDQFEIDLDHPKDQDHQWWSWRSRSKIVILPISVSVPNMCLGICSFKVTFRKYSCCSFSVFSPCASHFARNISSSANEQEVEKKQIWPFFGCCTDDSQWCRQTSAIQQRLACSFFHCLPVSPFRENEVETPTARRSCCSRGCTGASGAPWCPSWASTGPASRARSSAARGGRAATTTTTRRGKRTIKVAAPSRSSR